MSRRYQVVVQKWEESERHWGVRPDGWTMHLNVDAHFAYLEAFYNEQQVECDRYGGVPDEYTRPDGAAYMMDVDEETYNRIVASPEKMIRGDGVLPPKRQQGSDGWRSAVKKLLALPIAPWGYAIASAGTVSMMA